MFAAPPYGWSKDATRYVFAALLAGGEVVFFADSGEIQTAGPAAIDAVRTTRSFGRIGVSLRDARPSLETLDRAATRLENLLGVQVLPLEDHISRAARENFASRLEAIASLAAKLRLLSLAGVDRAQSVYDVGRSLLQQDGANAIAVLGTMDCTFPDDLRWAEAVAQSLENGATDDIRNVRQIINQLDELGRLFPATVRDLAREAELATVNDVLVSDDFYGRLSDLRSIRRTIRDRASEAYRIGFESYLQELEGIRTRLESRTDWTQVSDEDRIELARRLEPAMPLAPSDGAELSELRTVLFRRVSLSNMETDLISELRRRASLREPENPREVVLDVIELLPTRSLRDANDVAAWLDNLRGHLEEALAAGLPVRLEVR